MQRFGALLTTGDADHGYLLTAADVFTAADSDDVPRVSIYTQLGRSNQFHPGRLLYVLENPSFPAAGEGDIGAQDSFVASGQVRLESGTSYYVVFEDAAGDGSDGYRLAHTDQTTPVTGGSGWSIDRNRAFVSSTLLAWAIDAGQAVPLITARGRALADPSGSAPAVPAGLAFSEATVDSLKVSWVQPPGADADSYTVQWRTSDDNQGDEDNWSSDGVAHVGDATVATISGLTGGPGTDYDVRVRASNGDGDSEWSQVFVGTTSRRKPGADIVLHADNVNPRGMSYDETSLWVADADDAVLYRYARDGTQMATFATPGSTGGNLAVWSDATTVWVVPDGAPALSTALPTGTSSRCESATGCVWAYNISTGDREPDKEVQTRAAVAANGLWSDGATLWVGQQGSRGSVSTRDAVAYDLATGQPVDRLDFRAWRRESGHSIALGDLWSDGVGVWAAINAEDPNDLIPDTSHVRVTPLGSDRGSGSEELDLVVDAARHGYATGVASDRETLWVSSPLATHTDGTRKVLRAYAAVGAVANSPAFFTAARFADTLAVEVAENTVGYSLDLRPGDVEQDLSDLTLGALGGADAALFELSDEGVITTTTTFDFEAPADADSDTDGIGENTYELTVRVRDDFNAEGGADTTFDHEVDITITVTDVDESAGTVTVSTSSPTVGVPVTAVLTDSGGDDVTASALWLWEVADAADGPWTTANGDVTNAAAYTPVLADLHRLLRVTGTVGTDTASLVTDLVRVELTSAAAVGTLVSNIGQPDVVSVQTLAEAAVGFAGSTAYRKAVAFTTGDSGTGYVLASVDAQASTSDSVNPVMSIYTEASGVPGTRVHSLTAGSIDGDSATSTRFEAPEGAVLANRADLLCGVRGRRLQRPRSPLRRCADDECRRRQRRGLGLEHRRRPVRQDRQRQLGSDCSIPVPDSGQGPGGRRSRARDRVADIGDADASGGRGVDGFAAGRFHRERAGGRVVLGGGRRGGHRRPVGLDDGDRYGRQHRRIHPGRGRRQPVSAGHGELSRGGQTALLNKGGGAGAAGAVRSVWCDGSG